MNDEQTKKVTIRLSHDEYERLSSRGTPTTVAGQLVRAGLGGDGSQRSAAEGYEPRLLEDLRRLEQAVTELESTAAFRQITRDEVFSLSRVAAAYGEEISSANDKTAQLMGEFLERISSSLEMLGRVEKEISGLDKAAGKYRLAVADIEKISAVAVGGSRQFLDNLAEIERSMRKRVEATVNSAGDRAVEQGRRLFLWGGFFIGSCVVVMFFLHYFGVFYPDAAWLREALLGQRGGG